MGQGEPGEVLRQKIKHVLTIYPSISPSMLQTGIGTAIPPSIWRPVLEKMIVDGEVIQTEITADSPSGHFRMYTALSLNNEV